jgi:hypothetical protein
MKFYKDSIIIEDKGKPLVLNFLRNKLHLTCEWLVSKEDQRKGDIFCKDLDLYIELKVEQKKISSNFFIETWSNRQRKTKGWFYTIKANYLFYLFLEEKCLYTMSLNNLKKIIKLNKYKEVKQKKYTQLNDTWGLLVPRNHIITNKYEI